MVSSDSDLAAQVRTLTDYDASIIPDGDLQGVISLAKDELRAEANNDTLTFYDGNIQADRALFWLTCIFLKVKAGELDAPDLSIGELKVKQNAMDTQTGIWFQKFNQRLDGIASPLMGHTVVRRTDRTYNFDN